MTNESAPIVHLCGTSGAGLKLGLGVGLEVDLEVGLGVGLGVGLELGLEQGLGAGSLDRASRSLPKIQRSRNVI